MSPNRLIGALGQSGFTRAGRGNILDLATSLGSGPSAVRDSIAELDVQDAIIEGVLPPGKGIPTHTHLYAEVFYVITGYTDFLRIKEEGQEEWVRCGRGDLNCAGNT